MDIKLKIIVIEDHEALREITVSALAAAGHSVIGLDCAEALTDLTDVSPADLLIVDLNLPGESGFSLARRMREGQPDIGIIMVTARNQLEDKVKGYGSGADIYLTKPTSLEELTGAVQSLARRLKLAVPEKNNLRINLKQLTLSTSFIQISLSWQEALLLCAFIRAPQHQVENGQLIEILGKDEDSYSKASLEVQIVRLRKKLSQVGAGGQSIKVIRQFGYQLCVNVVLA